MWESKGYVRTIGCIIATIGGIVQVIPLPQISVWGSLVSLVGAAVCGAGVVNAASEGTLFTPIEKEDESDTEKTDESE